MAEGPWAAELAAARRALRGAEGFAARLQGKVARLQKADQSPVTLADLGVQALVADALAGACPGDPLMGEESASRLRAEPGLRAELEGLLAESGSSLAGTELEAAIERGGLRAHRERYWVLDPIDGTRGFLRGDHYALGLALIAGGEVQVAGMACPRYALPGLPGEGALFLATRGGGAWAEALQGPERVELQVSARAGAEARLVASVETARRDPERARGLARALGLAAEPLLYDSMLKYALVAAGEAELCARLSRSRRRENLWDHAPGILLVEEAGGRVSDARGARLGCGSGVFLDTGGILLASNGALHEQALAALRAAGFGEPSS